MIKMRDELADGHEQPPRAAQLRRSDRRRRAGVVFRFTAHMVRGLLALLRACDACQPPHARTPTRVSLDTPWSLPLTPAQVMGGRAMSRGRNTLPGAVEAPRFPRIAFSELEFHRIIGTGQFGMVRVVRHIKSNEAYALKVRTAPASCDVFAISPAPATRRAVAAPLPCHLDYWTGLHQ